MIPGTAGSNPASLIMKDPIDQVYEVYQKAAPHKTLGAAVMVSAMFETFRAQIKVQPIGPRKIALNGRPLGGYLCSFYISPDIWEVWHSDDDPRYRPYRMGGKLA